MLIDKDHRQYLERENSVLPISVLDEISIGFTSKNWLLTHLGKPDFQKVQGASVIYQYAIKEHNKKQKRVLVFYRSNKNYIDHYYLNVEIDDDVVQSYWKSHQL